MKIKTSELTGRALDWAVARADGRGVRINELGYVFVCDNRSIGVYSPSTDWAKCGELIDKYNIELTNELLDCVLFWSANCNYVSDDYLDGQTPQIAICRAVVAARWGNEVDIPDELVEGV
ncbi:DUF2591 domain-containing protein [Xenorhabdus bovienii]|uniref:phage protein NinX family protein n=1 Tax=Xenorhabdus bovienii TaxID=40576 RepID=UPI00237CE1F8|nr:phage protein NinX family protein [Xenorhabdus bovienii]MDE1488589.1 DUF2591 domain-containing protein [Xenorhabdus bovienii]MDE9479602.1 DUF2591 domain-containing protein [Xenorhabdus bovienii]MDE9532325.1 DUF2591 domain-containing protein [Xenorhabdus bovienii]